MAEQINLNTPDQVIPGTPDYHVISLGLNWSGPTGSYVSITLQGSNGMTRSFSYDGAVASTLIVALNKADLSVKSLQRRILERLVADGKLAGTIAGTPD